MMPRLNSEHVEIKITEINRRLTS